MRMKFYCPYCKEVVSNETNDVEQCTKRDGVIRVIYYIHLECNTKIVPIVSDDLPFGYNPYQE